MSSVRIYEDGIGLVAHRVHEIMGGEVDNTTYHYEIDGGSVSKRIDFQQGFFKEVGVNGFTNEVLIAVVKDRLERLNETLPSDYNQVAIEALGLALDSLEKRIVDRTERNVYDTPQA